MDFLELAKKRLRLLEILWLCIMTLGSIAVFFTWLNDATNTALMMKFAMPTLFFSLFGLAAVPFLINKALPIWNLWTPWKDRKTIWETECLVLVITLASMSWAFSCFFGISLWYAAKIQLCLGLAASPVLWITAWQRWKTHLLETPRLKGTPDESATLEIQEYEIRQKNNITAYLIAAIASTLVQLSALSVYLLLMDKAAVFSFFTSLAVVSLIVNLTIPPIGVSLAKRWKSDRNLRPSANFFIGTSLFSIGCVALPYLFTILGALSEGYSDQFKFGTYEGTLAIVVSTFILGYLVGAWCFEKFYHTESQSSNFI